MVLKKLTIVFVITLAIIIQNCGWKEENDKPDTPVWVTKTQPEDSVENGIDAEPLEHRIFMHWHPVFNKDLEGYKIFRCEIKDVLDTEAEEEWEKVAQINIYNNPEYDTLYYDEEVQLNYLYRYIIRSFDYDGNMSEPSDTIEYVLIEKATIVAPTEGQDVSVQPDFKWRNNSKTNEIVLRLEKYPSNNVIWITRFNNPSYTEDVATKAFNFDDSALVDELTPGDQYRWRVDCISSTNVDGSDLEASESVWQYFTVSQ